MVVAAVAAGLPLATIANVQAADSLDVAQEVFANQNTLVVPMAQTFTPQHSGYIDLVRLRIAMSYGALSMRVEIQDTTGGKPNGSVLGTSTWTGSVNPANWKGFTFNSHVDAGHMYSIVVTPSGRLTWYGLFAIDSNAPGVGQMWLWTNGSWQWTKSNGYDFAFEEYQTTGAPVNRPPVLTRANSTVNTSEGATATNTGTYSDPDGDAVTLSASIGKLTAAGGNWSWSYAVGDEVPGQTVTITGTDSHGAATPVSFSLTFSPVLPKATITGITYAGLVLLPYTPLQFEGGFTDAGALDTHTAYFDFGDGSPEISWPYNSPAGSGDTTTSYFYTKSGTYTVTYEVKDDDGDTSTVTAQVKVLTAAEALSAIEKYIETMSSLNQGEKDGLLAKYRAAEASVTRGNDNAACGQIGAALNDLSALTGNGRLSQTDSAALSSATWATHRALGCTKVKLSWLNLTL